MANLTQIEKMRPGYSSGFRCIGIECEDHCCQGWHVPIDRPTFEKYQGLPEIAPRLAEFIPINAVPTDDDYARVRRTPEGNCPFLDADRLCGVQKKYGEQYLSVTCSNYPRLNRILDGPEQTLSLSCPEAARLVLLNPRLLPEYDPSSTNARYRDFLAKKNEVYQASAPINFFWPLRAFTVAVLTDRRYAIWERLFVLGLFYGRLQAVIETRALGEIPKLLNDYAVMLVEKKLRPLMANVPLSLEVQVEVAIKFLERSKAGTASAAYSECMKEFAAGLGFREGLSPKECAGAYESAYAKYFAPFMEAHPYILENYLLNYVFKHRWPFQESMENPAEVENCQASFILLCILYAGIKAALIGMAAHRRELFGEADVIRLIYSYSRKVDHDRDFLNEICGYLVRANLLNTSGMAILLKN